jgi:hypothetical protein
MPGFKFREHSHTVEIEGENYTLNISTESDKMLNECSKKMLECVAQVQSGKKEENELLSELADVIDIILGEGAIAKIFAVRTIDAYDLVDLTQYITSEIKAYKMRRAAELAKTQTTNLEQRRKK